MARLVVPVVSDADQTRRPDRSGADAQEQVVAARLQLARPENLDLQVVTLGDADRLLRQGVRRELVRWCVLPFAGAVGRLAVLLGRDDLVLPSGAEAHEHDLIDLPPFRCGSSLPRAALEGAHDATFDDRLQAIQAQRLATQDGHSLVAPGPRRADELVMS